jgi:hypothetical protein
MIKIQERVVSVAQFSLGVICTIVALLILTLMWFLRMDLREMDDNYGGY